MPLAADAAHGECAPAQRKGNQDTDQHRITVPRLPDTLRLGWRTAIGHRLTAYRKGHDRGRKRVVISGNWRAAGCRDMDPGLVAAAKSGAARSAPDYLAADAARAELGALMHGQ